MTVKLDALDVGLPAGRDGAIAFRCEITMWAILVAALAAPQWVLIPVAPGESLAVTTAGDGDPIVLVPGLLGSGYAYRRLTPLLTQNGYRSIVIEPLGVGGSSRPRDADYSLYAQAGRLAATLDSLRVGPAYFLGHAVGTGVALRVAYRRPDLVLGVVSLDGGAAESAATPGFRQAMKLAPLIKLLGRGFLRGRIREQFLTASGDSRWVSDSVVAGYTARAERDFGAAIDGYRAMAHSQEPEPLAPHLSAIRCPVYLLLGGVPHQGGPDSAQVALMAELLPAFAADTIPEAGHFLHEEAPATVVVAVNRLRATVTYLSALFHD